MLNNPKKRNYETLGWFIIALVAIITLVSITVSYYTLYYWVSKALTEEVASQCQPVTTKPSGTSYATY